MPEHKHKHEHEHGVATTATSSAQLERTATARRNQVFSVLATDPYPHHGSAIHASGNGVTAVFDEDSVIPDLDND